jgi:hypothetical protein
MKQLVAGALTLTVMGFLFFQGVRRSAPLGPPAWSGTESLTPPDHPAGQKVRELLDSAGRGDVAAYLASFTGPLRDRLEREVGERGRAGFADDLMAASASRKSHAVFAPEAESDDEASVTVESVYPDRNERVTYRLNRADGRWLVTSVDTVRSEQPKERYGAPASYNAPEGPPVPGGLSVETGDPQDDTGASPR